MVQSYSLFLLIDIDSNITSKILSFADDTRVSRGVSSIADVYQLQTDLSQIYNWQEQNNMLFNEKKFELVRYGKDQDIKNTSYYTGPNGNTIEEKPCV